MRLERLVVTESWDGDMGSMRAKARLEPVNEESLRARFKKPKSRLGEFLSVRGAGYSGAKSFFVIDSVDFTEDSMTVRVAQRFELFGMTLQRPLERWWHEVQRYRKYHDAIVDGVLGRVIIEPGEAHVWQNGELLPDEATEVVLSRFVVHENKWNTGIREMSNRASFKSTVYKDRWPLHDGDSPELQKTWRALQVEAMVASGIPREYAVAMIEGAE